MLQRGGMRALGLFVSFVAVTGLAVDAGACSAPLCMQPLVTPAGAIPENLPGFVYTKLGDLLSVTASLKRLDTGEDVPFKSLLSDEAPGVQSQLVLIQPDRPFESGVSYELTLTAGESCDDSVSTYDAGDALALPEELGVLTAGEPSRGSVTIAASGPCSEPIEAVDVTLELELAAAAAAWINFLDLRTFVDGELWGAWKSEVSVPEPGATWEGRAVDRVFAECGEDARGLAEGRHTIKMVGTLPGSDFELESNEVEVELSCASAPLSSDGSSADGSEGCSIGRETNGGAAGLLAAVVGAMLLRRRRS